ncbi:hypothetical protein POS17_1840 [Pseudomonas sp. Os17]|nr:hypothetical protein POS17_1840 [Pseudomonas sp. Os17]
MPSSSFAVCQSSAWAVADNSTVKPQSTAIRYSEPIVLFLIVEVPFIENTLSRCHLFPPSEQADGIFPAFAANLGICLKRAAHRWPLRPTEQATQVFDRQVQATFSRRLAIGHSGDR